MLHGIIIKKFFIILFLFLSFNVFCATIKGEVIKVLDGDTITILDQDGGKFKIRFADIDAPESTQEYGKESTEYLFQYIYGKKVIIKFISIDTYGRIVGKVYLNDILINKQMVKNGYAWWYKKYSKDKTYESLQQKARKNKIGLWKSKDIIEPSLYRKLHKK